MRRQPPHNMFKARRKATASTPSAGARSRSKPQWAGSKLGGSEAQGRSTGREEAGPGSGGGVVLPGYSPRVLNGIFRKVGVRLATQEMYNNAF